MLHQNVKYVIIRNQVYHKTGSERVIKPISDKRSFK